MNNTPSRKGNNLPNWLDSLIRKSKGGRDLDKFSVLNEHFKERQVIRADKYDEKQYQQFRDAAKTLKELAESRWADDPSWYELIQDEFLALYKAVPKARSQGDMKPTHLINHAAMNKARATKEWEELRTYTELDPWASAMAAVEFGTRLGQLFDEQRDLMEAQKKLNEQSDEIDKALEDLQNKTSEDEIEEALDDLEQLSEELEEAIDALENEMGAADGQIRQAAREAAKEAKDAADNVENMLASFGTEPGSLKRMNHEARMQLASRIQGNAKLREMADMIGRMVRLALGEQARKIIHGHDEVHDVEMGNDIHRVLPSELTLLASEGTSILFLKKFAEAELLQYELRGTEKVARGAIICMVDSSGSMMGSREIWSKAVALALLNIANKQNRDFHAILFSSSGQYKEWNFPRGKASVEDVLDFAEYFYGGGTDYQTPISRAVEILQRQYADEKAQKGDLMMITDDECNVSTEWRDRYLNAKDSLAFRHYGVMVGATRSGVLDVLCDKVYKIQDLASGNEIRESFGFI